MTFSVTLALFQGRAFVKQNCLKAECFVFGKTFSDLITFTHFTMVRYLTCVSPKCSLQGGGLTVRYQESVNQSFACPSSGINYIFVWDLHYHNFFAHSIVLMFFFYFPAVGYCGRRN